MEVQVNSKGSESKKLLIEDVARVFQIFSKNKWFSNPNSDVVHTNLITMIADMTNDQKELIFELTERYLWITMPEYLDLITETINSIEEGKLKGVKRIFFFPIILPKDMGLSKSAPFILYSLKATHFLSAKFKDIPCEVIESYNEINKVRFNSNDLLFLVDDFVGSGDTVSATIKELLKNSSLQISQINALVLVAQINTLDRLRTEGIQVYSLHKRNRAITDYYESPNLERKIKTMRELEEYIPNLGGNTFGYNQTEAIVTMMRTPNNTFPIFWKDHKKMGKIFKAPFTRKYEK
jgi:hypoxanthine phosphoribosyltransferase